MPLRRRTDWNREKRLGSQRRTQLHLIHDLRIQLHIVLLQPLLLSFNSALGTATATLLALLELLLLLLSLLSLLSDALLLLLLLLLALVSECCGCCR
jgi:hypothetical protein